ncbi:MAG: hypothetical protein K0S33_2235 [Bacteroidetes bacterium]|jgi:hypothetical protein|nr:hypothetical protein [Bacteroidota bacterium]
MNRFFKTAFLAVPLAAGVILTSCGGDHPDGEEVINDSTKVDSAGTVNDGLETGELSFQVPSPGEMLTFIKMVGGKTNKSTAFLNSPDNNKNYTDAKSKALNFGIYSCDLSYCSTFEMGPEALKYFIVVKKLGDEIGISTSINPEVAKRLQENVGNSDSLAAITDDLYYSSFETLQNSKQGSTLALVIAGGYIESLYIVTNLVKYEANSPGIQRVADQKITLENIIEFVKKYESDPATADVIKELNGLKDEFAKLKETEVKAEKGKDGVNVLGGGTNIEMTADQYKAISEKIKSVRNTFTQTK